MFNLVQILDTIITRSPELLGIGAENITANVVILMHSPQVNSVLELKVYIQGA